MKYDSLKIDINDYLIYILIFRHRKDQFIVLVRIRQYLSYYYFSQSITFYSGDVGERIIWSCDRWSYCHNIGK